MGHPKLSGQTIINYNVSSARLTIKIVQSGFGSGTIQYIYIILLLFVLLLFLFLLLLLMPYLFQVGEV